MMRWWKRLGVLRIGPDDTLVVDGGPSLSRDQVMNIHESFARRGVNVVVMSGLKIVAVQKSTK